ncbi:MAG: transcription termination factor NusA [Rickettsiales bacterium]|jgi:N utilization substance protein A|nr:transcription termination factor NusA [Rickettsiales bacterium]
MSEIVSMPRQDLLLGIASIASEKMIDENIVFESLEQALVKIAKQKYGEEWNIDVKIDRKNGAIIVKRLFDIIDDSAKGGEEYNAFTQLTADEAAKYSDNPKVGEQVFDRLPEPDFGRMAFQTAKQIMTARVRDAEKGRQYEEFKDNIGDIVSGVVKRSEYGNIFVDINGRAEGYIRGTELIPGERLQVGDRVRALILDVVRSNSQPQILLTRTHPMFMERLFFQEVPEIYEGLIKIRSVARAPGSHAKIAVSTDDPSIDPVGMTVGIKGTRIQPVINECHGEKIDVILYSDDPAPYIVNAISPAKVQRIVIDEDTHTAIVVVNEDQQSLAIVRRGQNVRLASQLTGWNIDVMNEQEEQEHRARETKEKTELFMTGLDIDDMVAKILISEGFRTIEEIAFVDISELSGIEGFDADLANELQKRAKNFIDKKEKEYIDQCHELKIEDSLRDFQFIKREVILTLGRSTVRSIEDLADLDVDELIAILGADNMSEHLAGRIIMKAREIAYNIGIEEEKSDVGHGI